MAFHWNTPNPGSQSLPLDTFTGHRLEDEVAAYASHWDQVRGVSHELDRVSANDRDHSSLPVLANDRDHPVEFLVLELPKIDAV